MGRLYNVQKSQLMKSQSNRLSTQDCRSQGKLNQVETELDLAETGQSTLTSDRARRRDTIGIFAGTRWSTLTSEARGGEIRTIAGAGWSSTH